MAKFFVNAGYSIVNCNMAFWNNTDISSCFMLVEIFKESISSRGVNMTKDLTSWDVVYNITWILCFARMNIISYKMNSNDKAGMRYLSISHDAISVNQSRAFERFMQILNISTICKWKVIQNILLSFRAVDRTRINMHTCQSSSRLWETYKNYLLRLGAHFIFVWQIGIDLSIKHVVQYWYISKQISLPDVKHQAFCGQVKKYLLVFLSIYCVDGNHTALQTCLHCPADRHKLLQQSKTRVFVEQYFSLSVFVFFQVLIDKRRLATSYAPQ